MWNLQKASQIHVESCNKGKQTRLVVLVSSMMFEAPAAAKLLCPSVRHHAKIQAARTFCFFWRPAEEFRISGLLVYVFGPFVLLASVVSNL